MPTLINLEFAHHLSKLSFFDMELELNKLTTFELKNLRRLCLSQVNSDSDTLLDMIDYELTERSYDESYMG